MPIIFLHGLGQTQASWEPVIANMSKAGEPIAPNLPGLFRSEATTYPNLYRRFSGFCANHSAPLDLCGLSLGGILALQYTIEHPDRVRSLVLIGTQSIMPKKLLRFQNILFSFMPKSVFQGLGFGKRDFITLSKSMMNLDFSQDLSALRCPTLVVCGEKDPANKKASLSLHAALPQSELVILPSAGHEVNTDAPDQLARLLDRFYQPFYNQ